METLGTLRGDMRSHPVLLMAIIPVIIAGTVECISDVATIDGNIETFIGLNSTQEFIHAFSNPIQQLIVTAQMRYCPKTGFCTLKVNTSILPKKDRCTDCHCTGDCKVTHCCVDHLFKGNTLGTFAYTCQPITFHHDDNVPRLHAKSVTFCPLQYPPQLRGLCENKLGEVGETLIEMTPVSLTDMTPVSPAGTRPAGLLGIRQTETFRNLYCGLCNGVSQTNLSHHHTAILACNGLEQDSLSLDDFLNLDTFKMRCPRYQIQMIKDNEPVCQPEDSAVMCNITGLWRTDRYDPEVERACYMYSLPYTATDLSRPDGNTSIHFKNLFCAMCNGYEPVPHGKDNLSSYEFVSMPALMKPDSNHFTFSHEQISVQESVTCNSRRAYKDEHTNTCKLIHCAVDRRLRDGRCVVDRHILQSDQLYLMYLEFRTRNRFQLTHALRNVAETEIREWFLATAPEIASICEVSVRTVIDDDFYVRKLEGRIQVYAKGRHGPGVIVEWMKQVGNEAFVIHVNRFMNVTFKARVVSLPSTKMSLRWGVDANCSVHVEKRNKWLDVNTFWECPVIKIENATLPWKQNSPDYITSLLSGFNVSYSDYQLVDPHVTHKLDKIRVCISTYEKIIQTSLASRPSLVLYNLNTAYLFLCMQLSFVFF